MPTEGKLSLETGQPEVAVHESVTTTPETAVAAPGDVAQVRSFLRKGLLFIAIGLVLYIGLYLISELLVHKYTVRNRFYSVTTAPFSAYDYVILGASHAAVFDYDDMNANLEEMTGARILNLSSLGGGVVPNRLMLDHFLAGHDTKNVVYFVDSFAFYSPEWNEERVQDVELYQKAPLDLALARLLIQNPATRAMALGYVSGFYKINNPDRFKLDISEEEATRFDKSYRPVKQIDRQRMSYLYPDEIDAEIFQHYLVEFEAMMRDLREQEINIIVIKTPLPERVQDMLPQEQEFDAAIKGILQQHDVNFYDFTSACNDEELFFNTDHLNRTGVLCFYEDHLKEVLAVDE
jgi:hypothetical protein